MVRLLIVIVIAAFGCSRAGEEAKAKRAPLSPPPQTTTVPQELTIALEVDGKPAAAITSAQLSALEPDFADEDRKAWRLTRVLGERFADASAVVEALDARDVAVSMAHPKNDMAPQPTLMLTRRGEIAALVVEAADPFPSYHGQGGRLRRPGDSTPRVLPVVKLRVWTRGRPTGNQ